MRKAIKFFSSIACHLMIASNKQRQEHHNLGTIQRAKRKGAHEHAKVEPNISFEFVPIPRP